MPDLVSHLCAAQITGRVRRMKLFAVFALGAILPDILSRPVHILFPATFWYVAPMHSPLVCILYCALVSLAFCHDIRRGCFFALLAGVCLHLALDSLQIQFRPHYFWLFPFSWRSWWAGLFWPEQALFFLPVTLAVTAAVTLVTRRGRGARDACG